MTVAPAADEGSALELQAHVQRYVDEIVAREVATAEQTLAAQSTLTEEEAIVIRALADAIAAELITERVRLAVSGELDSGPFEHPDGEQCERIASLFELAAVDGDGEQSTTAVDQ